MFRNSRLIRLIRPIAWIVFLLPIMVGFDLGASKDTLLSSVIFGFCALFFVLCFGFSVNALGDVDVDIYHDGRSKDMNLSRQPLVTGEISILQAKLLSLLFFIGSTSLCNIGWNLFPADYFYFRCHRLYLFSCTISNEKTTDRRCYVQRLVRCLFFPREV